MPVVRRRAQVLLLICFDNLTVVSAKVLFRQVVRIIIKFRVKDFYSIFIIWVQTGLF